MFRHWIQLLSFSVASLLPLPAAHAGFFFPFCNLAIKGFTLGYQGPPTHLLWVDTKSLWWRISSGGLREVTSVSRFGPTTVSAFRDTLDIEINYKIGGFRYLNRQELSELEKRFPNLKIFTGRLQEGVSGDNGNLPENIVLSLRRSDNQLQNDFNLDSKELLNFIFGKNRTLLISESPPPALTPPVSALPIPPNPELPISYLKPILDPISNNITLSIPKSVVLQNQPSHFAFAHERQAFQDRVMKILDAKERADLIELNTTFDFIWSEKQDGTLHLTIANLIPALKDDARYQEWSDRILARLYESVNAALVGDHKQPHGFHAEYRPQIKISPQANNEIFFEVPQVRAIHPRLFFGAVDSEKDFQNQFRLASHQSNVFLKYDELFQSVRISKRILPSFIRITLKLPSESFRSSGISDFERAQIYLARMANKISYDTAIALTYLRNPRVTFKSIYELEEALESQSSSKIGRFDGSSITPNFDPSTPEFPKLDSGYQVSLNGDWYDEPSIWVTHRFLDTGMSTFGNEIREKLKNPGTAIGAVFQIKSSPLWFLYTEMKEEYQFRPKAYRFLIFKTKKTAEDEKLLRRI